MELTVNEAVENLLKQFISFAKNELILISILSLTYC